MALLTYHIKIQCSGCGLSLVSPARFDGETVVVHPCHSCCDLANERGFNDGYAKGWAEAKAEREEVPS